MRIGETGGVLEIPGEDPVIEIPLDRIRATADPDFRASLAERARRIGRRLRAMRLDAGLTPAAVAEKVGVSPGLIAGVEAGRVEASTDLIEHITGALGRRLRDSVEE
jgi:DNA-binding XRE family transcriptional regulator